MAKRNIYSGLYDSNANTSLRNRNSQSRELRRLFNMTIRYFSIFYSVMWDNYLAIVTIIAIVMLSYIIPDISKRIQTSSELGDMKKVVDFMSEEVRLAEAACLTDVNEVCHLQCTMQDDATETSKFQRHNAVYTANNMRVTQSVPVKAENKYDFLDKIFPAKNTSHKEIAIMSYVYTDSFDDNDQSKNNTKLSEL